MTTIESLGNFFKNLFKRIQDLPKSLQRTTAGRQGCYIRLPKQEELPRCSYFFLKAHYQFSTKEGNLRIQTVHREENAFAMERQKLTRSPKMKTWSEYKAIFILRKIFKYCSGLGL
jgi:hypothetical protein